MTEAAQQYSIEFNQEEIDKLTKVAAALKAAAGQNPEWNELADWLSGIIVDDETDEGEPDKPKRKKKK
jgi:hypothetical protein